MDAVFNAYFQVVGYEFFLGIMALVIIFEIGYTLFENLDML